MADSREACCDLAGLRCSIAVQAHQDEAAGWLARRVSRGQRHGHPSSQVNSELVLQLWIHCNERTASSSIMKSDMHQRSKETVDDNGP